MEGYYDIGLVGGGPSTVSLLDALAQRQDSLPRSVLVLEPAQHLWRGRPYRPDFDTVRVNAPARDMSLRAGDDTHFEQWLAARDLVIGLGADDVDPYSGARFVARSVYGDYLEQTARAALIALHHRGWTVDLVRDYAVLARPLPDSLGLQTAGSGSTRVGNAVFAVGAGRPPDPYGLTGLPGFIPEAYPTLRTLAEIDKDASVAVLGTGLTAVDAVLGLVAHGHRGRIHLVSRTGTLPAVRQTAAPRELIHFTPAWFRAAAAQRRQVSLAEVIRLMGRELAAAGDSLERVAGEALAIAAEEPVARLRRHLAQVDAPEPGLRILQQAVPEAGPDVWPLLPEPEKARLLAEHTRTLMSLCCPMPPANAAVLLDLIDAGQVTLRPAVRAVQARGTGGFRIATETGEEFADHVVNATNARFRPVSEQAESLIGSLIEAGLAEAHPHGGVHVERATSRMTVRGLARTGLYALGDLASGSLYFTFGIQSLVDRAADIAPQLVTVQPAAARRGAVSRLVHSAAGRPS